MSEEGIQERIGKIKKELIARHAGEEVRYTGCFVMCHGGGCILKVHFKNGKVVCVEPDDLHNQNVGREDEVMTDKDFIKQRVQQRPCECGYLWPDHNEHPERILYPLKRVEGAKRGEGKFQRISWDEAIDIIAKEMKYCKEKFGKYSILIGYPDSYCYDFILGHFDCGVQGWGWCSWDPERQASHLMYGVPAVGAPTQPEQGSMADMLLNTKLILLWGATPDIQHYGTGHQIAYFIRLARERGVPVISIDPRYSASSETLSDQWIPIKPGTDMAMMAAMAHVLFKEDLWNHEFVEKWVEPKGFEMWRKYIMGEPKAPDNPYGDGIPKTPEWAEKITGVPAETIYELTRLYAKSKPTYLWKNWSVARKSRGENVTRAAIALQSMMGYNAMPGGSICIGNCDQAIRSMVGQLSLSLKWPRRTPSEPLIQPRMYRSTKWTQAILLLDKVKKGEMTTEEYRKIIGWNCDPSTPNPEPKILIHGNYGFGTTNTLVTAPYSTNDQIKALDEFRLVVSISRLMTTTCRYSDIILPLTEIFDSGTILHGRNDIISAIPGDLPVSHRGETKSFVWILTKLARALGLGPDLFFEHYTTDENWYEDWERYYSGIYDSSVKQVEKDIERYGGKPYKPFPPFQEFRKLPYYNVNECFEEPHYCLRTPVMEGKGFQTKSGKIEFCAFWMLDESQRGKRHHDHLRRWIGWVPNDWGDQTAHPTYQPCVRGMEDPLIKQYPLMLLTPHSRYRNHTFGWLTPHMRECHRHTVWLSVADAKKRGIKDGDLCRVYNDVGEVIIPAYVTSGMSPGVTLIHHGAYYDPDEKGRDWGGASNVLLYDDKSPACPPHATGCVQVEKHTGETRPKGNFWYGWYSYGPQGVK